MLLARQAQTMSDDAAVLGRSIRRQQIAKCRRMAEQAERSALTTTGATHRSFNALAKQWSMLANEMERDAIHSRRLK